MPDNDAIGSKRLDGRHGLGAEQSFKPVERALAVEHHPDNCALRLIDLHRLGK